MFGAESTLNALLKQYPNAREIIKQIGCIDPAMIDMPAEFYVTPLDNIPQGVIRHISLSVRHLSVTDNIYPVLCASLSTWLSEEIKNIVCHYENIISNHNALAADVAQQSVNILPEEVQQLSLYCARLNQSAEPRIANWNEFFKNYPVVTQKIEAHVAHTLNIITDIFFKLKSDQQTLQDHFAIKDFTIVDLELFAGDYHQCGKSIVKVAFSRDMLIYKPRNADNETLINNILADTGCGLGDNKPGIPRFISGDDYSWHECIQFNPAGNLDEVLSYYRKIGVSLALFYCLNGTDFHYENIIYSQGTPWFIDLECLFTISIHHDFINDSVLNTLIIPTLQGAAFDSLICGIGTKDTTINKTNPEMNKEGKVYLKINPVKLGGGNNTPNLNDEALNDKIINEVIDGYLKMISLLKESRAIQRNIATLKKSKGRILFRATKIYGDILTIANHPTYSSIPLLRNTYIACALYHKDIPIDVIRHEYLSLIEGRIPVFYVDLLNEICYSIDGEVIDVGDTLLDSKAFLAKPYKATSAEDIVLQKELINISLRTLFPDTDATPHKRNDLDALVDFITTKTCRWHKQDIYLNLKREMNESPALIVMRGDLYNGLGGALFLQICNLISEKTTENTKKVRELYDTVPDSEPGDYFGCFDSSRGSMLYNEYLMIKHAPGLIDNARFFNRLFNIVRTIIRQDEANNDVLAGIAGILIVTCRMHAVFPSTKTHVVIKFLSKKLLSQAKQQPDKSVTWGRGWTAFSHGNAGIAYALTLANNILHDRQIENAIIKALRYENAFRIDSGWNDIGTYNTGKDHNAWCHGATGIYMSRKAILNETGSRNNELLELIESDIAHYHQTQINRASKNHLSLCHGIFGNAIIDPDRYGTYFDASELVLNILQEKSLMLGKIGGIYANFYFSHAEDNIPNLLLLE